MNASQTYLARACESLMTLLLFEYLYCFYLDASLLILFFRIINYYSCRVLIVYNAGRASRAAEAEREAARVGATARGGSAAPGRRSPRRARRPTAAFTSASATAAEATAAATTSPAGSAAEQPAMAERELEAQLNDDTRPTSGDIAALEATYVQPRLTIFRLCCTRTALIVLLHVMSLGSHYLYAAPPRRAFVPLQDALRTTHPSGRALANESAATALFTQEVAFWRSYLNSRRFIDFAAAWEPFSPLPCVLPLLDLALLCLEYLIGLLTSVHGEKLAREYDDRLGQGHVLGREGTTATTTTHTTTTEARADRQAARERRRAAQAAAASGQREDLALDEIYAAPPAVSEDNNNNNDDDDDNVSTHDSGSDSEGGSSSGGGAVRASRLSTRARMPSREADAEVEMQPMKATEHTTPNANDDDKSHAVEVKVSEEAAFGPAGKSALHTSVHLRRHGQPWYRTVSDEEPRSGAEAAAWGLHAGDWYDAPRDGWRPMLWRWGRRAWRAVFCGWRRELLVLLPPSPSPQSSLSPSESSRHTPSPAQ